MQALGSLLKWGLTLLKGIIFWVSGRTDLKLIFAFKKDTRQSTICQAQLTLKSKVRSPCGQKRNVVPNPAVS
jgi:hypothetical protein